MEIKTGEFQVKVTGDSNVVTRNFVMKNGDTLSYTVTVIKDLDDTMRDLHRKSAQEVIDLLQKYVSPKPPLGPVAESSEQATAHIKNP